MGLKNLTGTLPSIGPFRTFDVQVRQPKRATVRHYPKVMRNGKCVKLVPCDDPRFSAYR